MVFDACSLGKYKCARTLSCKPLDLRSTRFCAAWWIDAMPKTHKLWLGALLLAAVLALLFQALVLVAGDDRAVPEVRSMLRDHVDWLKLEKDLGALSRDLRENAIVMLGEASNLYLVTHADGHKYFVFKSEARLTALDDWISRGGKLFVLNQTVNPSANQYSRVAQQALRLFSPELLVPIILLALCALALSGRLAASTRFEQVTRPTLRFQDVIGVSEAKRELTELAEALRNRAPYEKLGARPTPWGAASRPARHGQDAFGQGARGRKRCELHRHRWQRLYRQVFGHGSGARTLVISRSP